MTEPEIIIVGAGMVGAAIGWGLARAGVRVLLLDGGDRDPRAARANFGLVWVQGKGADMPAYSSFTRISSDLWPGFCKELAAEAGTRIDYQRDGGLVFCLGANEFQNRTDLLARMHNQQVEADTEMLDRAAVERLMPKVTLGADVVGASFCHRDGHVNPLQLLEALHRAIERLGGRIAYRSVVDRIEANGQGFRLVGRSETWQAPRVVVAAGLATSDLTAPLGLAIPLRPERGQILVTERLPAFLPLPASGIRQTAEGTVMLGATREDTGLDTRATARAAGTLAHRAVRIVPQLAQARLVRQWAGLRVLPADGGPIYDQSDQHPGLFAAICHSGVTLAAAHACRLAPAIAEGRLPEALLPFSTGRFHVQKRA